MPINTESVLRPAWSLPADRIEEIYIAARDILEQKIHDVLGMDGDYNIRALVASDIGETNDIWAETVSATGSAYQDSQIAAQQIGDDRVVCLYGLVDTSDPQLVTAVRIQAGNAVRAQWDLFPILGSPADNLQQRTMYAMTPVVLTSNISLTIRYYPRAFSPQPVAGVEIAFLGLIAEKDGTVIQP